MTEEMEKQEEVEKTEDVGAATEPRTEPGESKEEQVTEQELVKQPPPLDVAVFKSPLRPAHTSPARSSLPFLPQPSMLSPRPLPAIEGSPAHLPSPGSSSRHLSLPPLLSPMPATPNAQEEELEVEEPQPSSTKSAPSGTFLKELAPKLQRKEQEQAARREDKEQQELATNLVPCVPPGVHLRAPGVKSVVMSPSSLLVASTPSRVNPSIFDLGGDQELGDTVDSVRKALEQQNTSKDESVVKSREVKDNVKIKTYQRKKAVRTDMPGLAEQLKVGRITL